MPVAAVRRTLEMHRVAAGTIIRASVAADRPPAARGEIAGKRSDNVRLVHDEE